MDSLRSELKKSQEEVKEWKRKYSDLAAEKETLYDDMIEEINELQEEIKDLKQVKQRPTLQTMLKPLKKENR